MSEEAGPGSGRVPGGGRWLALVPVLLAVLLAGRTVGRDSCTVDEFGNLPLTVVYWHGGALHIDPGNPPLTRWIQGIPLLAERPDPGGSRAELATIDTSWDLGYRFEAAHADDYHHLLVKARAASVALFALTVLVVFLWAHDLGGRTSALGAGLLAATSPNLLAHGRLVTPDIGLTLFVVAAAWCAWRATRGPGFGWVLATGILAGAAVLSKLSGLLLLPVLGLAVLRGAGGRRPAAVRLTIFAVAALLVIHAGYGFSPPGAFRGIPTPFPAPLVTGIESQLAEAPYPAYLLGENRNGGWPGYYAVAFLVKVPLPALALFAMATVMVVRSRRRSLALPLLLAAAFFLAFGLGTKKNVGLRYLLPVLPLLHVTTAAVLAEAGRRRLVAVALTGLAVLVGGVASGAPLSYFNETHHLLGGKRAILVDSNLDWGQGLPELREWMEREGVEVVQLAYFGRIDPEIYDVTWTTLRSQPVGGPVAISATLAVGRPYVVRFKERHFEEPTLGWSRPDTWKWIEGLSPDEELAGGSILVWRDLDPEGRP